MEGKIHNLSTKTDFVRNYVCGQAEKEVMKKTHGLYPAPIKIIDSVKAGLATPGKAGYERECQNFGDLGVSDESAALMNFFFGKQACEKNNYGAPVRPTQNVAVLG